MELREERSDLEEIADYVYENVFLHYTMKQWWDSEPIDSPSQVAFQSLSVMTTSQVQPIQEHAPKGATPSSLKTCDR